jgi:hypothetical protein
LNDPTVEKCVACETGRLQSKILWNF